MECPNCTKQLVFLTNDMVGGFSIYICPSCEKDCRVELSFDKSIIHYQVKFKMRYGLLGSLENNLTGIYDLFDEDTILKINYHPLTPENFHLESKKMFNKLMKLIIFN